MIKHLLLAGLLFSSISSYSQTNEGTVVGVPPQLTREQQDSIFTKVDEQARFPGGLEGWRRFLERNLRAEAPILDKSKKGMYTVAVQFIVDRNGVVNNVKTIHATEGCPTCISEAERVIKKGPRWIPARHNGRTVKYHAIQQISFVMN